MTNRPVLVPDLGDFKSVEVVDVLVKAGDVVALETPLVTLETEKATMDVPSTAAGRVARVVVKKGDKVSTGSPVVELEEEGGTAAAAATPEPAAATASASANAPRRWRSCNVHLSSCSAISSRPWRAAPATNSAMRSRSCNSPARARWN